MSEGAPAATGLSEAARLSMGGNGGGSGKTSILDLGGRIGGVFHDPFAITKQMGFSLANLSPFSVMGKQFRTFGVSIGQLGLKGGYAAAPGGEGGPISPPQVQHVGGGGQGVGLN